MMRTCLKDALVGFDSLQAGIGIGFVLQGQREPVFCAALGHDAYFGAELASVEIENELTGNGFEPRAVLLDDNVATVGEDAQLI